MFFELDGSANLHPRQRKRRKNFTTNHHLNGEDLFLQEKSHLAVVFAHLPKLGLWVLPVHAFLAIQLSPPHSLSEIQKENTFHS